MNSCDKKEFYISIFKKKIKFVINASQLVLVEFGVKSITTTYKGLFNASIREYYGLP